jgi:hypothetical protein
MRGMCRCWVATLLGLWPAMTGWAIGAAKPAAGRGRGGGGR